MLKRTDVILSVGTVALVLLAVVAVAATGTIDEFVAWAWERHHNVLSWYIRPLFFLPFCYFAYKRSRFGHDTHPGGAGHQHVLVPGARAARPQVLELLAVEREYLTGIGRCGRFSSP